jgi:hypothetical protein
MATRMRKAKDGMVLISGADVYTHLNIDSGNEWGIKASLYSSTEMLKEKEKTIDSFFSKQSNIKSIE